MKPNLCFLHIPKTGGTSTSFILDYAFQRKSIWNYEETYTKLTNDQIAFIQNGIGSSMCYIYGGHVTYANYEQAIKACNSQIMATIRDPLQHFISKFNHDFNIFIRNNKELIQSLESSQEINNHGFSKLIKYENVSNFFSIESILSNNAMNNYLKAYLSHNDKLADIDYLIPVHDSERALQLFMHKWNRDCFKLQRRDPAIIGGVQTNVKLNEGATRIFTVMFREDVKKSIKESLADSYFTYNELLLKYKEDFMIEKEKGFKYKKQPFAQFVLDQTW